MHDPQTNHLLGRSCGHFLGAGMGVLAGEPIMTTVFVTKYALTDGIQECVLMHYFDATNNSCRYAVVGWPGGLGGEAMFRVGVDAHEDMEMAVGRAMIMRDAAIKSAEKKLSKLRKMEFGVKEAK